MLDQERKETSTPAPITPRKPEGGLSGSLRRLFGVSPELQYIYYPPEIGE